ncbi:TIGR00730 family Rossman fold protein [Janthinobacterium sp. 17J80-10]|uniref:LOG family protein n=1 Tax=Janthinobacterium sp. 17J80-10 TaxID=2497863 RepID=UPI0010054D6A|nr:TIGR00730 family Rossman fold protein [Janthinobacterium sp. 17J80-10]QAU34724.1 TIGR00730 family Rossman fold protein [Janthinobacterium sp. 17J80-10]
MKSICIYCGSSPGILPAYAEAARALAQEMVKGDIALVYGGGKVGLMGVVADEVMRLGGTVTGIIPKALLDWEVGHHGLTQLHVVKDMHERKAMMAELSDGFIALPGGIGTLEELFETLTWAQLGFHDKPIGLLNVAGFYDGLLSFLGQVVSQGFLKQAQATLLMHEVQADRLLARFREFRPGQHPHKLDTPSAQALLP